MEAPFGFATEPKRTVARRHTGLTRGRVSRALRAWLRARIIGGMDAASLQKQLNALKWSAVPHGDDTFKAVHDTEEGAMVVYVRLHENWLVASVVPFLDTKGDNSFELARWLLRMNRDMFMTKFAYDDDGDVVLTVELPTENLDPSEVASALTSLLTHAVAHRRTLRVAAEAT